MEHNDRRGKEGQLEEHSLPGTNQAGKGPEPRQDADPENRPKADRPNDDALEEHSLPGTNQAGKGPGEAAR